MLRISCTFCDSMWNVSSPIGSPLSVRARRRWERPDAERGLRDNKLIDTTERFLRDIAARVGVAAVDEVRLFPPLRQSGVETGVAVVAALPLPPEPEHEHGREEPPDALTESAGDEFLPIDEDDREIIVHRHTVFTALYRHTLKGPDRGKWEMDMRAEADAPLVTLDAVVRGVMKRAGEPFEPERISGSAFRTIIESVPGATV